VGAGVLPVQVQVPLSVLLSSRGRGWESIWADLDALSAYWRAPERSVVFWAGRLWEAGGRQVLDLGCGVGRHTVALTHMGFTVVAADVAPSGLATCARWLAREGLNATLVRHEMELFPFPDGSFDGLIAFHVIYHTTVNGMQRILSEMRRVLRPGGELYITIISRVDTKIACYRADIGAGKCQEIEPFTFLYVRGAPGDKYLPHHYCDEADVRALMTDFIVDDLGLMRVAYTDDDGVAQTGAHYHIQARRPLVP
jgi:tellurite methyltransferase